MAAADILWMIKLGNHFDYRRDGRFDGTVFHQVRSHFPCDIKRSLLSEFPDFDDLLQQHGFKARFDTGLEVFFQHKKEWPIRGWY